MLRNKSLGGKIKFLLLFFILIIAFVNGYDRGVDEKENMAQESQQDDQNNQEDDVNAGDSNKEDANVENSNNTSVMEDGTYTSKEEVAEYIQETAKTLQMEIIAMEIMPDHVHLIIAVDNTVINK